MRTVRWNERPIVNLPGGAVVRPVSGSNLQMINGEVPPYFVSGWHKHEQEQILVVLEGELTIETEGAGRSTLRAGDAVVLPPWLPHQAKAGDVRVLLIDIYTPPRDELRAP